MAKELPETARDCVWCCAHYSSAHTRARTVELFCSRRCETEARYWLFAILSKVQEWRTGAGF